jgi:DNA-binding FrmR family transcriptional regulator
MDAQTREDALRRLSYVEGHLRGIRKMLEDDQYCVDVLKQLYAVQRALDKIQGIILAGHLRQCVPEGIRAGRDDQVIQELTELYDLARR